MFIKRVDKIIVKRPYLYELLKNHYKLNKLVYIPFARAPSTTVYPEMDFSRNRLVTCSCASSKYKIENDYAYRYEDIVCEMLIQSGASHIHIGEISDQAKHRIQQNLHRGGIDADKFIHIPYARRLSDVFIKYKVNVLIQTFPIGGALVSHRGNGSWTDGLEPSLLYQ